MNNSKAIMCGTFDPITLGHTELIERACRIFDTLVVGVAHKSKSGFSESKRLELVNKAIQGLGNVTAVTYDGMTTDFAKSQGAAIMIRGLRNVFDLEFEKQLTQAYKTQDSSLSVIYMISAQDLSHISSTMVRELVTHKGKLEGYIPKAIISDVTKLYKL